MAFAHLHVHTEYSLLDGSNKIKEYVNRVKELGMNSAAITDHGVMFGVIDFYRAARDAGINPILGCEVYVAPSSRFDRENNHGEDRYYHLVLLAENNTGYSNLMKIVSKGFVEGYYYRPRVDMEVLETYHEGIIALSACLAGEVQRALIRDQYEEAKEIALKYEACFGKGNFFLELQDHGIPEQRKVNPQLLRMSKELGIGLVATNDVHYTYAEDVEPHDILLCIQTGKKRADENRMRYEGGQYYVKSEEELSLIHIYARESWFIEMTKVQEDLVRNNNTVNWIPESIGKGRFGDWLENIQDWGISRNRYWGTPLNIWECEDCGHMESIGSRQELAEKSGDPDAANVELHRPYIDAVTLKCPHCGKTMRRVPEVIDCWFDSGAMPFAQHHYPFENKDLFEQQFPAQFISEAVDQTRGWFYSLMAESTLLFNKAPYENVIVLGHVQDENGQKMSKSKGNAVDPFDALETYGADAIRWYFYINSAPWLPNRFHGKAVQEGPVSYTHLLLCQRRGLFLCL